MIMPSSAYMFATATTSPLAIASSKAFDMPSSGLSAAAAAPASASAAASRAKRNGRDDCIAISWWGFRVASMTRAGGPRIVGPAFACLTTRLRVKGARNDRRAGGVDGRTVAVVQLLVVRFLPAAAADSFRGVEMARGQE